MAYLVKRIAPATPPHVNTPTNILVSPLHTSTPRSPTTILQQQFYSPSMAYKKRNTLKSPSGLSDTSNAPSADVTTRRDLRPRTTSKSSQRTIVSLSKKPKRNTKKRGQAANAATAIKTSGSVQGRSLAWEGKTKCPVCNCKYFRWEARIQLRR